MRVEAAGCRRDFERFVLEHPPKGEVFKRRNLTAEQSNIGNVEHQRRDTVDGAGQVVMEENVRLVLVKILFPVRQHRLLVIIAADPDDAGDLLLQPVFRHRIETLRKSSTGKERKHRKSERIPGVH